MRVVRSGAVEIIHDGVVLDLLGVGELFGHGSMLSGLPTGFTARAHEDTLCYRIGARRRAAACSRGPRASASSRARCWPRRDACGEARRRGAAGAAATRHTSRSRSLIRAQPVVVAPDDDDPRHRAADGRGRRDRGRRHARPGSLGIVTDRDLRSRVVAAGVAGRRAGQRGDDGARLHGRAGPPRRRRPARDARPRRAPLPGDLAARRGRRRRSPTST